MKQFFKIVFGSALGFVLAHLALVGIVVVFVSIIVATSSGKEFTLKESAVLQLKLNREIVDRSQNDIYSGLINVGNDKPIGLDEILESIKKAKNNDHIKGILLEVDFAQIGIASAREIRNALINFKESGKFIVTNGGFYSQAAYYIASVSDQIILNPSGVIEFKGLASAPVFYKNALDKLGIEMQLIKVGTYKSYAEQYTNTEMSPENREQVSSILHSVWSTMLDEISVSRQISKENLNRYADEMMAFQQASQAVTFQLADTLLYRDEINATLALRMGLPVDKEVELVSLENMKNLPDTKKEYVKEKIALVYALGGIDSPSFGDEGIKSDEFVKMLREIKDDDKIKAVVLRVNSPGGSAYGSEQIWREISLLKQKKPVIVSMADYAASGGYYIACAADSIVAQPTTLTGSIGIFGIIPNIKGLTDKLGINFDIVKTNEKADMPALNRSFTLQERNIMQVYVNEGYELFVKRCADGRNMTTEQIKAIAEGRVWAGKEAQQVGLVDELGGLDKAIEIAQEKANISAYRLVEYPKKKDFMTELMSSLEGNVETKILKAQLGDNYKYYMNLKNIEKAGKIQAVMPFEIEVK